MNKFGDNRRYGIQGPPGQNAFDMTGWTPKGLLRMFRENTDCSFYFKSETDGILFDDKKQPIGLLNHGDNNFNAICLSHFYKPVHIHGLFYALPLDHTIYKISEIGTAVLRPSIMFVALTFKVSRKLEPGKDYTIFTNDNGSRGVIISSKTINILGAQTRQELTYDSSEWNTILIQWSCVSDEEDQCFFYLNRQRGFFRPQKYENESRNIFIGGHPNKGECAPIYITRFDVYGRNWLESEEITDYLIPKEICKLILDDITINDM